MKQEKFPLFKRIDKKVQHCWRAYSKRYRNPRRPFKGIARKRTGIFGENPHGIN